METKDFLLFLGPLLGALIGGGVTALIRWKELSFQRKISHERFMIEKLEEAYRKAEEFRIRLAEFGGDISMLPDQRTVENLIAARAGMVASAALLSDVARSVRLFSTGLTTELQELEKAFGNVLQTTNEVVVNGLNMDKMDLVKIINDVNFATILLKIKLESEVTRFIPALKQNAKIDQITGPGSKSP